MAQNSCLATTTTEQCVAKTPSPAPLEGWEDTPGKLIECTGVTYKQT